MKSCDNVCRTTRGVSPRGHTGRKLNCRTLTERMSDAVTLLPQNTVEMGFDYIVFDTLCCPPPPPCNGSRLRRPPHRDFPRVVVHLDVWLGGGGVGVGGPAYGILWVLI